jgi:putative transposase
MARLPRLSVPGELHLVAQRGHNQQPVFVDDTDRAQYLASLREAAREHGLAVHAYALLETEIWLLATPAESDSLSKAMQATGRRYVAGFNRRHGRSGTLWEGRFRAAVIEANTYFLDASCLVENKPAAAGLAPEAAEWPWSSARHHLGGARDPLVQDHPRYWALGNTPFDRELKYRQALMDRAATGAQASQLEKTALKGWALGGDAFLRRIAEMAGRPAAPRPRGRPRRDGYVPNI